MAVRAAIQQRGASGISDMAAVAQNIVPMGRFGGFTDYTPTGVLKSSLPAGKSLPTFLSSGTPVASLIGSRQSKVRFK